MRRFFYLLVLSFLLIGSLQAQQNEKKKKLYKWRDANGNIVFSDEPKPGATEIPLKEVPVINLKNDHLADRLERKNITTGADSSDGTPIETQTTHYDELTFTSPQQDGVIRNNGAVIELSAKTNPSLNKNHKIQFYLDGKSIGSLSSRTSITINDSEYGPHSVFFEVIDSQGKQIQKSDTVSFALLHVVRKKNNNN